MAAKECILVGNDVKASKYLEAAKNAISTDADKGRVGDVLFMNNEIKETKSLFQELLRNSPDNQKALSYLAGLYLLENDIDRSNEMIRKLNDQRAPYQYGDIDYWIARGYMIGGKESEAVKKLASSVAQGYRYGVNDFQNDFIFTAIKDKPDFQDLMKYWH
jgi:predicted Zn-dependent protease